MAPRETRPSTASNSSDAPALRVRHAPGSADVPRPRHTPPSIASADPSERLAVLVHELANLLDGSMRCLGLARRSLGGNAAASVDCTELDRRLDIVQSAMEQMAALVRAGMPLAPDGPPELPHSRWSLADTVRRAAEVMRPVADERGIALHVRVGDDVGPVAGAELYPVLADAIRNAIESVARTGAAAGTIEIHARAEGDPPRRRIVLEVIDDGAGPPPLPEGEADRIFDVGFTTRAGGSGIGLALARDIVRDLGGDIRLLPRDGGDRARPGAVLRITCPAEPGRRPARA